MTDRDGQKPEEAPKTYVILLRRMKEVRVMDAFPVEAEPLRKLAEEKGVQLDEIFVSMGIFEAAMVCRAPDGNAVARMLNAMKGWHSDALFATQHVVFQAEEIIRKIQPQRPRR